MSATITVNWFETFKKNLKCGHFPSKSSNPYIEMLTGLVGLQIEYLVCQCPTALDAEEASANIGGMDTLSMWYEKIKCGEMFESDAQAWTVFAMAQNKLLECCVADAAEEAAENLALGRVVTNPAANTYVMVVEDFDSPRFDTSLYITNAAGVALTLPLEATIPVPIGYRVKVIQLGAGVITADAEGAATIQGTFVTTGVDDVLFIEKIGVNAWHSILVVG